MHGPDPGEEPLPAGAPPHSARGSGTPAAPRPASPSRLRADGRIHRRALDPDAVHVVLHLQRAGHETYLVGGCVRDLLLGLEPKDFDVATDASPARIKRLFRNAYVIGRRFRLVHVRFPEGKVVEAATFRRDPGAAGRDPSGGEGPIHSDNVFGTAEEDAFRRDFTVNALFYDPSEHVVVDWVGGLADVEARVVRAIGDPSTRLREDPVRMIRALHFAARMGGTLEPSLLTAIRRESGEIEKANGSRLYVELMKVLTRGAARETFRSMYDLGVLSGWLPGLSRWLSTEIDWPSEEGGTHEAAREGEPDEVPAQHRLWNLLATADRWGMASRGAPESLALAILLGPWILDTFRAGPRLGPDFRTHAEMTFRPLALRMSVPRRASEDLFEILWTQESLRRPPEQRRRVRSLVLRRVFPEALAYLELDLAAGDRDAAAVAHWRAVADEVWGHEDRRRAEPAPEADAFPSGAEDGPVEDVDELPMPQFEGAYPPRDRRHRGGRGRRAGAAASPPAAESSRPPTPARGVEERAGTAPSPAPPPAPPPASRSDAPFGAGLD